MKHFKCLFNKKEFLKDIVSKNIYLILKFEENTFMRPLIRLSESEDQVESTCLIVKKIKNVYLNNSYHNKNYSIAIINLRKKD